MDYITSGTRRMRQLVDGLLQLSRVGTHTWAPEAVDSDALVVEVESLLHSSMAESGAEVVRQDLPVVHGDPRLLTQLFQNLLANALKFRGSAAADGTTSYSTAATAAATRKPTHSTASPAARLPRRAAQRKRWAGPFR